MESQTLPATERPAPREIAANRKAYAFERSLGIPPAEACRRVGGKVENGQATKWERSGRVQAWISYYRSLGQTVEMLAAKRQRLEERLSLAAYGDLLDFAELIDEMEWDVEAETWKPSGRKTIAIDWAKVMQSPLRVIVSEFAFHKDTGKLTSFKRDDAQGAMNQLRDMHGFKAPAKTELTGKGGAPLFDMSKLSDDQLAQLETIAAAASGATVA